MMKGALEEKNAATMGALDFDETFYTWKKIVRFG